MTLLVAKQLVKIHVKCCTLWIKLEIFLNKDGYKKKLIYHCQGLTV